MENEPKISEKLYCRYEYLAKKYAAKISSYEELSFEFEDLLQEFRLKIFTAIKAYGKRWAKYQNGEAPKPVAIRYYLESACANKAKDFMKFISRENYKTRIDDINFDFGIENDTVISPESNKFLLNGIDLLEGLTGKERVIFSLYLRGSNTKILNKVYFNNEFEKQAKKEVIKSGDEPIGVMDVINMQRNFLIKKYGNELLQQRKVFQTYSFDEE